MSRFHPIFAMALGAALALGAAAPSLAQSLQPSEKSRTETASPPFNLNEKGVPPDMVLVPGTFHQPLYPSRPDEEAQAVEAFFIDRFPVTNGQFLNFVMSHPRWKRGRVPSLFASENYLRHWESPESLGDLADENGPVVQISWFAARAYCNAQGKRLPTEAEWEVAAKASETEADASSSAQWRQKILAWYSRPTPRKQPPVGQQEANYYGIYDLHGLVWEWIDDFNAYFIKSDSRGRDEDSGLRFCGAAGLESSDAEDYASFMRSAMRGSLTGKYTGSGLGFRCARDLTRSKGEEEL